MFVVSPPGLVVGLVGGVVVGGLVVGGLVVLLGGVVGVVGRWVGVCVVDPDVGGVVVGSPVGDAAPLDDGAVGLCEALGEPLTSVDGDVGAPGTPLGPGCWLSPAPLVGSSAVTPLSSALREVDSLGLTVSAEPLSPSPEVTPIVTTVPRTATSRAPAPAATRLRRAPVSAAKRRPCGVLPPPGPPP
ncbi:hypothetical protein SBI_03764 [Streptomyces bingchenggensis BCW-1]|uniref:Uncharacterized protein n=1 Tax=Streptomyces bingchenggensis (strain BCW-1) TaxID=749414 RepID=D7CFX7_STRBB|nr:hypothetical protein SBI_03764 [Streptomyces bingchenggensis BCW-1]